jgi:hypothetical protein
MQDEETILSDIVLKRSKRAVIAITGKSGIESMVIHLAIEKVTIQRQRWKDWTSFKSHCCPTTIFSRHLILRLFLF